MLAGLGAFFVKIGIGSIVSKLADAYATKANAQTEQQRIEADARIRHLELIQQAQIADNENWMTRLPKVFFFGSVSLYVGMTFLLSAFGIPPTVFRTLEVPAKFDYVVYAVVGYYTVNIITKRISR